ncbi:chimerin [Histoplasma capsulatum G186AR]|uniref:Chimerin n=1 Tax=Ajellomyces capsulatus TaxID=5037 RepID=A0A8H8D9V2_AJECA|nr:chimerin [Histoplasma capsulatum]QSS75912.1 chimerin [Histoplasma capsulatum G186AR]
MESPTGNPESPLDDDTPIPCQGCGEILEEGKAFELAGKRWHIDCFRCNTCGTFLDSDANLLLLGDGSLICNNCTYSCSSCGNKIEDLAILTGDQAFCANCFKCRNCKRKIENLRYARTSQGIFCMDCHESLMARRRKRSARAQRQKVPNVQLDKSLPSLPPTIAPNSGLAELDTPSTDPSSDAPVELPSSHPRSESRRAYLGNDVNVESTEPQPVNQDNLILPSSTYKSNRHSALSHKSNTSGGEEFLIPVAFDPTPSEPHSPNPLSATSNGPLPDYFGRNAPRESPQKQSVDRPGYLQDTSHSAASSEQPNPYEEKGRAELDSHNRQASTENSSTSIPTPSPDSNDNIRQQNIIQKKSDPGADMQSRADKFKLQDVPKGRKAGGSRNTSRSDLSLTTRAESPVNGDIPVSPPPRDSARSATELPSASELDATPPRFSQESRSRENGTTEPSRSAMQYPPKRGDSLEAKLHQSLQRKEVQHALKPTPPTSSSTNDATPPISSNFSSPPVDRSSEIKGPKPSESTVSKQASDTLPSGSSPSTHKRTASGNTSKPKPSENRRTHSRDESVNTQHSEDQRGAETGGSPLLRYSAIGDFSLDEDMARILGSDDVQNQESFLKRVSNSVRHGRSFSDKGARLSKEQKWPKSPSTTSHLANDVSSPTSNSPESRDQLAWYKNELQRERLNIIEKDQKISELEASLNASTIIKHVNAELREKRSTMVFLEAQKEIVMRELEVLNGNISAEKQSGNAVDLGKLSNSVLREFAQSIQRLKDSFAPQIEELIKKRNDILEELSNLGRMKDKSFQEFEQLSLKNSQLAELNNDLVHQIQGIYKVNTNSIREGGRKIPNGLGIYAHQKDISVASLDGREPRPSNDLQISTSNTQSEDAEPAALLQGPQVVSIRKGQVRKFNWKKGGQNVAKGVTKGLKGAFNYAEGKYQQREGHFMETAPYGSISSQGGGEGSSRAQMQESSRQGFGFFGNQKAKPGIWKGPSNDSTVALVEVNNNSTSNGLFGCDLEQRIEIEKCVIPGIVTRCIEEVELRGMDCEGIYRKSGGSSQVQMIRDGFEKSSDYDISDPDLDIHAVTSTLKQYFRKLPNPLITYDVYDLLLDATAVTPSSVRIDVMRRALLTLPSVHRDVLEFLIFHLRRVVEREKENLMTSLNVAVVFAPTILRPESLSREMIDVNKKNEVLQFLVDNCQDIFMGMQN